MVGMTDASDVFGAIAAPARRAILLMLAERELPVMELAESFEMTLSAVSQHLGVLRSAGLVSQRKSGRQRLYRLNPAPLKEVADWLTFYQPFWQERLSGLGDYLDRSARDSLDLEERTT